MTTRPRIRCTAWVVALALTLGSVGMATAADNGAREAAPPADVDKKDEPRCVHGCERWGKVCNVDPRGVYKCRRICEKFGEICE
ncbi:MAG: hypothetical protein H6977_12200 [Gammaproteobacteria bacterium]|nr:hypothetical protein [Gammaproteobacteria bacterium]MCP5200767.1 hypothetical protein [Gammaproteobacteria bacterium]